LPQVNRKSGIKNVLTE